MRKYHPSLSSTHTHTHSLHHPQKLSPTISLNQTHMQTQLLCVSLALSQTHTLISPSNLPQKPVYSISFSLSLSPSHLPVLDMKTRYGPRSFFTVGRGIAAASSIATNSAYASMCEREGYRQRE